MKSTAERYRCLAEGYVNLSDKFHQLDVAHMTLKKKLVPVIKAIKDYQALTNQLKQDKAELEQTVQALTARQQRLEEAILIQKANEAELSATVQTLTDEKATLQASLTAVQTQYDALADLEALLQGEPQAMLTEAEQQMELVEETLQEMTLDSDPDLSEADKLLINSYQDESSYAESQGQGEPQSKIQPKPKAAEPDCGATVLGTMPFVA
ncbi:MAG: hypothetical protein AAF152_19840 [Cyanobacteria bacterium P01_A01_bin.114]